MFEFFFLHKFNNLFALDEREHYPIWFTEFDFLINEHTSTSLSATEKKGEKQKCKTLINLELALELASKFVSSEFAICQLRSKTSESCFIEVVLLGERNFFCFPQSKCNEQWEC